MLKPKKTRRPAFLDRRSLDRSTLDRSTLDRRSFSRILCAIGLAGALLTATGAGAEIFKKEDLLRGITTTHAQCDAISQALWLNVDGRDFCVRYYLSTAGGEGQRPVVILQGDQIGKVNPKNWSWADTLEAKDVDSADIMRAADGISKMSKTTAIYLARIGVDGTSGNHLSRKTVLELDLMNSALDAIKRRHGFEGFHLAGQSGGSKLVGGLIGLRHDITCAVLGSGQLAPSEGPKNSDLGRTFFDVTQYVSKVAQNRSLRVYLVTDKTDKRVPAAQQIGFVDRLRHAGRQVPQYFVEATDDLHHGVFAYTELVTAGCVLDRPEEEVVRALATLGKRNAEINERRRKEAGAKASILAAARQAQPDPAVATAGKK